MTIVRPAPRGPRPRLASPLAGLAMALVALALSSVARADGTLQILPADISLSGPKARQILLAQDMRDGQNAGPVAEAVVFESSDSQVVKIENGQALPVANGQATLTARAGQRTATANVVVRDMDKPFAWGFRNHVQSVLTKAGCNSGACHGALAGKNGFRLSLRGYDSDGDFRTITRQARGRRVVPSDPGRSLLLTKPSGAVPHKGGLRFRPGSLEYRVVAEWIASGTPAPRSDDPQIQRIEVLPPLTLLSPGREQQLVVLAHFSDGHVEDVTRWTKYASANEAVASVDESGKVKVAGHGEGAITAWYLSKVVIASVTSPFDNPAPAEQFASFAPRNFIDELVLAKLKSLKLPPSPPATDAEFLRRAFIDAIGVLPTADEARAFLADASPDKRDKLVEALLARPEFVDYWTYKWSDLLLVSGEKLSASAMWTYYSWIRRHVEANTPWDKLARELIVSRGSTLENGGANFFVLHRDPLDRAETATVAFLGMSINCARCHNHPLEKWTNNQYYAMANLFSRVRTKSVAGDGNHLVFNATEGELIQPLTGKPQSPAPLDGETLAFDAPLDRREHLANWLTSPDNPYFSRAIANRVWANFLGAGLVESIDDMRLTNPASNEALLSALARRLAENKFDLKDLMRSIMQSQTYRLSSRPMAENAGDRRFYSHYYPRRMMAEVLLDAFSQVSGTATEFNKTADNDGALSDRPYPAGYRAVQLPDSNVASYFLKTFGRPEREITCECERSAEPSMVQVLHIANGDTLNLKLAAPNNRLDKLLATGAAPETLIDEAYLCSISRFPTAEEKTQLLEVLAQTPAEERRAAFEDLFWSLLSSREFLFNH